MRQALTLTVAATMLFSGCTTNTGAGAYVGAQFGTILGSAIGGLTGGPRGSDVGTIIGMAGGAALGAAIGSAADAAEQEEMEEHYARVEQRRQQRDRVAPPSYNSRDDDAYGSGFDADGAGDDRLYDFESSDYTGNYSAHQPTQANPGTSRISGMIASDGLSYSPAIEIRNARFVDDDRDGSISRGELCKVVFEIRNNSAQTLYDVQPMVVETSGNRHIYVSPSVHVERLAAGHSIRYTAMVKADERLREGTAMFSLSVVQGGKAISQVTEFSIPTRKIR